MLNYCTFRNTHPPALAAVWRSRAGQQGLTQPVSVDLFEQFIFGKPYFDCEGLVLAFDDDRAVGFGHAAFGPNEKQDGISTETGAICMLMVRPDCAEADVVEGLLGRCEAYLRRRGAKVLHGGGIRPLNPFYLGLYGGSELPGVLDSDVVARELYQSHGYEEVQRILIFRRSLEGFRPPVDRWQMQFRRTMILQVTADPPAKNWWEACTTGDFDLTRFEVTPRGGEAALASVTVRGMESPDPAVPGRAVGVLDVRVDTTHRRQGLATFVLGESFRQLAQQGVAIAEAHTVETNAASVALLQKLGLDLVNRGTVFRKNLDR